MGLIMRNGIPYGGREKIDAGKYQILTGDGNNWAEGCPFYGTALTYGLRDFYYKKNSDNKTYDTTWFTISNTNTENNEFKISSIKLKGGDEDVELLTKENLEKLNFDNSISQQQKEQPSFIIDNGTLSFMQPTDLIYEKISSPDNIDTYNCIINKEPEQIFFQIKIDKTNPSITLIKKNDDKTKIPAVAFSFKKLIRFKPYIIEITTNDRSYNLVNNNGTLNTSVKEENGVFIRTIDSTQPVPMTENRFGALKQIKITTDPIMDKGAAYTLKDLQSAYISLKDTAKIDFDQSSIAHFSGQSKVYIDGNTRFTLHDNAWVDINQNAQVKIGTHSQVFIDGRIFDGGPNDDVFKNDPHVYIHGGLIDIDSYKGAGLEQSQKKSDSDSELPERHQWAGITDKQAQHGPYIHVHDKASLIMNNGSLLNLDGSSAILGSGNGQLLVKDGADVDFTKSTVHFQGGEFIMQPPQYVESSGTSYEQKRPIFRIKDLSETNIQGAAKVNIGDNLELNLVATAKIDITNGPNSSDDSHDTMKIYIHDAPNIYISKHPSFYMTGDTLFNMSGSSYFCMQSSEPPYSSRTDNNNETEVYSPCLVCNIDQFIFHGKGVKGKLNKLSNSQTNSLICWPTERFPSSTSEKDPLLIVQGYSRFILGGQGSTWFEVSNHFNEIQYVRLQGNSFIQTTGHSHTELHDYSTIVMRGPWINPKQKNGQQEQQRQQEEQIYPIKYPWRDGQSYDGWSRPIEIKDGGPLCTMYDESALVLRGEWDETEDLHQYGDVATISFFITDNQYNTINSHTQPDNINYHIKNEKDWVEAQAKAHKWYLEDQNYIIWDKNKQHYDGDGKGCVDVRIKEVDGKEQVTVSNFKYTTKPPTWSPHIKRKEHNPLLELFDNAEIRLGGNIYIGADNYTSKDYEKKVMEEDKKDEEITKKAKETENNDNEKVTAITIKDKENHSVSFTVDDLIRIKKLISEEVVKNEQEATIKVGHNDNNLYFVLEEGEE